MLPGNNVCNDIAREEISLLYHRASSHVPPLTDATNSAICIFYATLNTERVSIVKLLRTREIIFFVSSKFLENVQMYIHISLEQKLHGIEYTLRIAIYLCMNLFDVDNTFVSPAMIFSSERSCWFRIRTISIGGNTIHETRICGLARSKSR